MTRRHLLPGTSTTFEKGMALGFDREDILAPTIESLRTQKLIDRPDNFLPWLSIEYGLGEISRFFADQNDLIDTGIPWQRLKGTPAAIIAALGWIDYDTITIHDVVLRRRLWNRFQIEMGEVPTQEEELERLLDAEYLGTVSAPARSPFYRGFELYDVRPLEYGWKKWGESLWGNDSGVRVPGGKTKWSHGQDYSGSVSLTETQRQELSVDYENGDPIGWDPIPANTPGITWQGVTDAAALKVFLMSRIPAYIGFYDAADQPIGYRRAFGVRDVTGDFPPIANTAYFEIRCRTDFGDGFEATAAKVAILFHSFPSDLEKPGKLWLEPGEIAFNPDLTSENLKTDFIAMPIEFRRTVREHVTLTVEV